MDCLACQYFDCEEGICTAFDCFLGCENPLPCETEADNEKSESDS